MMPVQRPGHPPEFIEDKPYHVANDCPLLWDDYGLPPRADVFHSPAWVALKRLRQQMKEAQKVIDNCHDKQEEWEAKERQWLATRLQLANQAKMAEQAKENVDTMYRESMDREKALRSGMDEANNLLHREGYHQGNLLEKIAQVIADKQKAERNENRYRFYVQGMTKRNNAPPAPKSA
jgi:chromosome condensin MukBEF ATPase and DNA-binding subunit MukB